MTGVLGWKELGVVGRDMERQRGYSGSLRTGWSGADVDAG